MSKSDENINGSVHNLGNKRSITIRDVIIDASEDDIVNPSDYEDSRIELNSAGHNLTSVLMNPRDSFMDNLFDEFSSDQRMPIQSLSDYNNNLLSMSSHSISSQHSSTRSILPSSLILFTTKTEDEQFNNLMKRIENVYNDYINMHNNDSNQSSNSLNTTTLNKSLYMSDDLMKCYHEVPEIYFKPEFSLHNIDMFNQSMGTNLILVNDLPNGLSNTIRLRSPNGLNDKLDGLIPDYQQEKLSKYLDLIELSLLKHIWIRSSNFFRVLDDIRILQSQVSIVYKHISDLRSKYALVNEHITLTTLRIPKLYKRFNNENILFDKLQLIQRILLDQKTLQIFIDNEDFSNALELINQMKNIFYNEKLDQLVCMRSIGNTINSYITYIYDVMSNKFVNLTIEWSYSEIVDIDITIDSQNHKAIDNKLDDNIDSKIEIESKMNGKTNSKINGKLDSKVDGKTDSQSNGVTYEVLDQLIHALLTNGKFKHALNLYKSHLSDSIRIIIRTCVVEYLTSFDPVHMLDGLDTTDDSDTNESTNTPFAHKVREMNIDSFLLCLNLCYDNVLIAINKSYQVYTYINTYLTTQITSEFANQLSENELSNLLDINKSCLLMSCELSQKSITQLLSLKKDVIIRLTIDKIKILWEKSIHFINEIEKYQNKSSYILRQSLYTQTKSFLDFLHDSYKTKLVYTLDNERWLQCDVSIDRQMNISKLVNGKLFINNNNDEKVNVIDSQIKSQSTNSLTSLDTNKKKELKPVVIDSVNYNVVWSVLFLIDILIVYLDISYHFTTITNDIIIKAIELIRLFDNRTRQLVLGAQAIQSAARLKSISAKHLGITAQSLNLISNLLPHIRAVVLIKLPPKHQILLIEFDRISHELIDHHSQIVTKFVSIVNDFIDISCNKLKLIDWDRFQGQCEYFDEILRNVTALHRVLISILPIEQLQDIFNRIFLLLSRKIPNHFEEIYPSTQTGRQRILDEITHLVQAFIRFKSIDCKNACLILEDAFKKKYGSI